RWSGPTKRAARACGELLAVRPGPTMAWRLIPSQKGPKIAMPGRGRVTDPSRSGYVLPPCPRRRNPINSCAEPDCLCAVIMVAERVECRAEWAFGSLYNEMTRTRLAIIVAIKLCISIR